MIHVRSIVARFRNNNDGAVAILFGLSCVVLMAIAGIAVDSARFYNMSSKVQDALDAASLAGARNLINPNMSDSDIAELTKTHYENSIQSMGVRAETQTPVQITVDRTHSTVEATSRLVVKSMFGPLMLMPSNVQLERTSKVVFDMKKVELSMVLDITGSMNDNNKLADMKVAASDVIDQLMDNAVSDDAVRIAVAPFSASVNAGVLADSVSAATPNTGQRQCGWVQHRGWVCTNTQGADIDNCVIERQGSNEATDAAPVGSDALPVVSTLPYGNYVCPNAAAMPLKGANEKDQIKDIINNYQASGATAGHIGAAWGWYLLSPNWSSVLPGDSQPLPYEDKNVMKTVIFMTDGIFNTSYYNNASDSGAAQSDRSYQTFQSLCQAAKDKKITMYTVGFALQDPRAISELQSCASGSSNFFDAKTGADLKKAFKAIADKLNTLRVAS